MDSKKIEKALMICLAVNAVPFLGVPVILGSVVLGIILLTKSRMIGLAGIIAAPMIAFFSTMFGLCLLGLLGISAGAVK